MLYRSDAEQNLGSCTAHLHAVAFRGSFVILRAKKLRLAEERIVGQFGSSDTACSETFRYVSSSSLATTKL